jgi:ketosteroid isomerase-like protein
MAEVDIETLRRGYEALNRGDVSEVLELLDPDIEWREGEVSPEAGLHHGRESFERFLRSWVESFEDFRIEPEEIVPDGKRLIAVVHQSGRGTTSGIEVSVRIAHVWTVRDGKAVAWEVYRNPEAALRGTSSPD